MKKNSVAQPLVFEPIFMERVWGGRRLELLYGKRLPPGALIGESWEIVDRPEAQSVVHNGPLRGQTLHDLWQAHRDEIFGDVPDGPRFPILAKLLDAQEILSLQVHPPSARAAELGGEPKTEFWYIAAASPQAELFAGLKKRATRATFEKAIKEGKIPSQLHRIALATGDAFFLPSGRLHALGAGNVIVEIQQNSDTTYRVFDWGREKSGAAPRKMHIEEALQCIDFEDHEPPLIQQDGESLVRHELFEIEKWELPNTREIAAAGTFALIVCLTGALECGRLKFKAGDFFLLPANSKERVLQPASESVSLLRVTIPRR
jgi:mannose-6-phosphate isomerase